MNAINKTANSNQNPNLESARRDSLREEGPAQVNFSRCPQQSRQLSHYAKNRRENKNNRAATVRYLSQKRERKRSE